MSRSPLYIGIFAKYPTRVETARYIAGLEINMNAYPILGLDYEFPVFGKLEFAGKPEYVFDGGNKDGYTTGALSALWVRFGGGLDVDLTQSMYVRAEMLYGVRMSNWFEIDQMSRNGAEKPRLGHGLTLRAGVGFRLENAGYFNRTREWP
jgi:opacity protein-like surface antigen